MVVGAARAEGKTPRRQRSGQSLSVGDNLPGILLKLRAHRLLERHGNRRGGAVVRAALQAWEHRLIEGLGVLRPAQDHPAARPPQRLVRSRSYHIYVRHRTGMHPGGHQPGNMRDVGDHDGPHRMPNLSKARKVNDARIGRAPAEEQLGPILFGQRFDLVEVDLAGVPTHSVLHGLVVHSRNADSIAVRQMASVRQRQAHDRIARRAQADVHSLIGRRA